MAFKSAKYVAEILSVDESTLRNWRFKGVGPRFLKLPTGAIRYATEDLEAYIAGRFYRSTAEARATRT